MNVVKQINYWVKGSKEDFITAELLITNKRLLHGLFWCHLSVEKAIKAIIVKQLNEVPPRSHNLIWLIDKTKIVLNEEQQELMGELMVYQLEVRYPEHFPVPPSQQKALDTLSKTKNFYLWLMNKL